MMYINEVKDYTNKLMDDRDIYNIGQRDYASALGALEAHIAIMMEEIPGVKEHFYNHMKQK